MEVPFCRLKRSREEDETGGDCTPYDRKENDLSARAPFYR